MLRVFPMILIAVIAYNVVVFGSGVLPSDFKAYTPRTVHGLVAKLAMGLVALHVVAALYHQFVLRDGLLGRMRPGRGA